MIENSVAKLKKIWIKMGDGKYHLTKNFQAYLIEY